MTTRHIRKELLARGKGHIAVVKECGRYLVIKNGKIYATHIRNMNAGDINWWCDIAINIE